MIDKWMNDLKFCYLMVDFHDSSKSVELLNLSYASYFTFEPR